MIGQTIPLLHGTHCSKVVDDCSLKWTPFGWVKDALSAGASSKITGKKFYSRYIWWSIIGGYATT